MKMKTTPKTKDKKLLLNLIDGERHRHRVALVTEEGEWNQHEPNSGMARMFVVMLLVHVVLIGGIIIYDFMGEDESPQQTVTQAARAMTTSSGLPQTAPEIVTAQAQAAADTVQFDSYEMRSGDSLKSIATKFGTTEEEITRLNMIDKGLQIGPGTMLRVPKQPVLSAIPVDSTTLKPKNPGPESSSTLVVQDQPPTISKEPSEAVKASEAPASLSAALTPMSLLTPGETPPVTSAIAAADTPATAPAPKEEIAALPAPVKPNAAPLLQENAPEAKRTVKTEPKALPKPAPVPPPSQMLKKIADAPPAPAKKSEPSRKAADSPSKSVAKATPVRMHTLQPGETLYRLSSKYGVSVTAIQKANNIKNPNAMREGMKLVIPAK